MKNAFKFLMNAALPIGLVLFSLKPSITNRIERVFPQAGCHMAAASAHSDLGTQDKNTRYRGSFEKSEKRNPCRPAAVILPIGCFYPAFFPPEALKSSSGSFFDFSTSESNPILRI